MKYYIKFLKIFFAFWIIIWFWITLLNDITSNFKINIIEYYKENQDATIILFSVVMLVIFIYLRDKKKQLQNNLPKTSLSNNILLLIFSFIYLIFGLYFLFKNAEDLQKTEIFNIIFFILPTVFILPLLVYKVYDMIKKGNEKEQKQSVV